jgi:hypothetical protein
MESIRPIDLREATHEHRWINRDKRLLKHSEVNFHHVMWERRYYQTSAERRYRQIGGLVLPLEVSWHDELHANIRPPLKPCRTLIDHTLEYAHEQTSPDMYKRFEELSNFFSGVAMDDQRPNIADQALRIANNMQLQAAFIFLGGVERYEKQ